MFLFQITRLLKIKTELIKVLMVFMVLLNLNWQLFDGNDESTFFESHSTWLKINLNFLERSEVKYLG